MQPATMQRRPWRAAAMPAPGTTLATEITLTAVAAMPGASLFRRTSA